MNKPEPLKNKWGRVMYFRNVDGKIHSSPEIVSYIYKRKYGEYWLEKDLEKEV